MPQNEMPTNHWIYDPRYGQPIVKDGCGIFGILRKSGSSKISNTLAVNGISCIKYRGSDQGAGYACFDLPSVESPYLLKAFVRSEQTGRLIEAELGRRLGKPLELELLFPNDTRSARFGLLNAKLSSTLEATKLEHEVDQINSLLLSGQKIDGRIFSVGRSVEVFKEVGYPLEVARLCNLEEDTRKADLWIAHTRQPTNSPGSFPIWSHPFSSLECAIAHNGDVSSFGANVEQLSAWGLKSHVGTDSEVIARLLERLLREEKLSLREAATVLTNPFERNLSPKLLELLSRYRGARLDGPFAVVAGYCDSNDIYLIALTDRSKFRPILLGEDEDRFYVASEENQIRNISKNAKIWTPEPGSYFIASLKQGLIESGTSRNLDIQNNALDASRKSDIQGPNAFDATGKTFAEINKFLVNSLSNALQRVKLENVSGQRYIGIGIDPKKSHIDNFEVEITGFPGNCLANLNEGATFEVYGNVGDDLADTMHDGSVIVHGNARDVVAQAIQGGEIFVRGSVGNRAAIQMREYKGRKPVLVIGETADDYLGEYMAGGTIIVLNLSNSEKPVGNYVGTGMVGGTIFVRGKVKDSQMGLQPHREDILNYLRTSILEGEIDEVTFRRIEGLEFPTERELAELLPRGIYSRLRFLYFASKYTRPVVTEFRKMKADELASRRIRRFFELFNLPETLLESIFDSEFTVVRTSEERVETPIPPQEVQVEE